MIVAELSKHLSYFEKTFVSLPRNRQYEEESISAALMLVIGHTAQRKHYKHILTVLPGTSMLLRQGTSMLIRAPRVVSCATSCPATSRAVLLMPDISEKTHQFSPASSQSDA